MNAHNENGTLTPNATAKAGSGRRWIMAAVVAVAAGSMAIVGTTFASAGGMHGHGGHHQMDAASMDKHIDAMLAHVLSDGTAEQKAKVKDIAKQAMADLRPIHEQLHTAHARAAELLTAQTIDRAALEQLRVEQLHQADLGSQRIATALADAAEVLTPAQRVRLAEQIKKHHSRT